MTYRREIDGLRALAVLPVIFYHAGFDAFRGGFVGVDVFFVISGYLITSVILADLQTGTFSLVSFYERRARRILPALLLVTAVCIPVAWVVLIPGDLRDFCRSLSAVAVFGSNILFWSESGYFDTAAPLKPLLHTWSLAVEEQFYLLYPLGLLFAWKLGTRWTLRLLAALAVASLGLAHWGALHMPSATFFLLPTRGWELLLGALIAFSAAKPRQSEPGRGTREAAAVLGLCLVIAAVFWFDESTPFPSLYALVPTVGTALLILFATPGTMTGRLLGNRWLVGIGLISYSAYLWHHPLFVFARNLAPGDPGTSMFLLLSIASVGLAFLSWRFVEQPFRRKGVPGRRIIFSGAAAASALLMSLGLAGDRADGFPRIRMNDDQQRVLATALASPERARCHVEGPAYPPPGRACEYFFSAPRWVVFGDSHAVELAYGLAEALRPSRQGVKHLTFAGCVPMYGRVDENNPCSRWTQEAVDYITGNDTITSVVVSYRILLYLFGEPGKPNGIDEAERENDWHSYVGILQRFADSGKRVFLVLQAPELTKRVEELVFRQPTRPDRIDGVSRQWWEARSRFVRSRIQEIAPEVTVVDPARLFCDREACAAVRDGVALYYDDDHMSIHGAGLVAAEILKRATEPVAGTGPLRQSR
jgi:peptidoglycan/LPS O-acetylase OafA/YrhL